VRATRTVELPTQYALSTPKLEGILGAVFRDRLGSAKDVHIESRERADQTSTFPNEIVRCRVGGGCRLELFCKHEGGFFEPCYGHRGGVVREARVYETVLSRVDLHVPPFYGAVVDAETGWTSLVLGYLRGATRSHKQADSVETIVRAAGWAGFFHTATAELRPVDSAIPALDAPYFAGWAHRAVAYAPRGPSRSLLAEIADAYSNAVYALVAEPATLVHGECYPKNVVVWNGEVYPTDWESAAVGAGEIDLAALTEYWRPEVVARCRDAYLAARGHDGGVAAFERRLDLAYLYFHFRWLGDDEPDVRERNARRLTDIVPVAERLGLI
jgi:hypothetical protein